MDIWMSQHSPDFSGTYIIIPETQSTCTVPDGALRVFGHLGHSWTHHQPEYRRNEVGNLSCWLVGGSGYAVPILMNMFSWNPTSPCRYLDKNVF